MTTAAENRFRQRIGHRMRKRREQLTLTTTELARMVGISQAQISRLESALQGFRSTTLHKIAKALNVDPAYFVIGNEALSEALEHPTFADLTYDRAADWLKKHRE